MLQSDSFVIIMISILLIIPTSIIIWMFLPKWCSGQTPITQIWKEAKEELKLKCQNVNTKV